ncbi:MAG: hypothetical protein GY847_25445 [Proteobacteria bacterium]|nr:hypothetical protein [Pseudomonadota bacterium]
MMTNMQVFWLVLMIVTLLGCDDEVLDLESKNNDMNADIGADTDADTDVDIDICFTTSHAEMDNDLYGGHWFADVEKDGSIVIATDSYENPGLFWFSQDGQFLSKVEISGYLDNVFAAPDGGVIIAESLEWDDLPEDVIEPEAKYVIRKYTRQGVAWQIDLPGRMSFDEPDFGMEGNADYFFTMNVANNAFVIMGGFSGELIIGKGEPNETSLGTYGDRSLSTLIARYNLDGTLDMALETDVKMLPEALAVAKDGTIFVIGTRSPVMAPVTAAFDVNGNKLWANDQDVFMDGEFFDYRIESIAAADGSYYVASDFYETVILSDRFGNKETLNAPIEPTSSGYTAYLGYFIAKYSAEGELKWAQNTYKGDFNNYASVLATAATTINGTDLLIAGSGIEGTVTFGNGTDVTAPSQFVAYYNSDGTLKWLREFEGSTSFLAATETSQGAVALAGLERGSDMTHVDDDDIGKFFLMELCK